MRAHIHPKGRLLAQMVAYTGTWISDHHKVERSKSGAYVIARFEAGVQMI